MSVLIETVQLGVRIGIVWAAGFVLAVAVRAALPDKLTLTFYGKETALAVPYSVMGFWTCVLGALIVTGLVVVRAMLAEIGWAGLR